MDLVGKRIIVTGSEGFLGRHLVQKLRREGAEIIGIAKGGDVTDWDQVKIYHDIDIIYHLAAKTYIPTANEDPREMYRTNLIGTLNMLELGRRNGAKSFIFASSYIYGHPKYIPINESHPVNPTNAYSRSKALAEDLCGAYYQDYGLGCVIIRAFNIYGEGQKDDFLIPTIIKQIAKREIELRDSEPRRDFLYVNDAVEAYVRAAKYCRSNFEVFNIGSGVSYSIDEIVRKIIAVSGQRVGVRYLHLRRENEVMNTVADIRKAREKLGWEPKFSIEEGLKNVMCKYSSKKSSMK